MPCCLLWYSLQKSFLLFRFVLLNHLQRKFLRKSFKELGYVDWTKLILYDPHYASKLLTFLLKLPHDVLAHDTLVKSWLISVNVFHQASLFNCVAMRPCNLGLLLKLGYLCESLLAKSLIICWFTTATSWIDHLIAKKLLFTALLRTYRCCASALATRFIADLWWLN